MQKAREAARDLVPTAGTIISFIVGRDVLCESLLANLRQRHTRPQVLVGDIGAGKTGVLVRLTELLAEHGTIPVPIRLPAGDLELDFEALAQERFLSEVNADLVSAADGETTWRRLRRERKVCVLADGLDEVLAGEPERDSVIRDAIRKAYRQRLPLVLVLLYGPFRTTDAAIVTLEPLSYEVALAYCGITAQRTSAASSRTSIAPKSSIRRSTCKSHGSPNPGPARADQRGSPGEHRR